MQKRAVLIKENIDLKSSSGLLFVNDFVYLVTYEMLRKGKGFYE